MRRTPVTVLEDPIAEARRQWEAHGWSDAAPGMAAVTSLVRAAHLAQARVDEALKQVDITFARFELLTLLMFSRRGAMPMSKVSARLQVHPASVTHAVNRLVADGLAERIPDPTDGRGALVAITDQGVALLREATPLLNDVFTNLGMASADLERIVGLCTVFRHAQGDGTAAQQP
ncbi:MarR family winged helix-turn-helix transcriptional regulator [Acidipropionibacterium timonense]|uniref:MarR family winged helix-turn-helix transcriptional regulator n=1 Tax=Acidipropionibacterium timonense TaxID=2161818 RepID=UPI0010324FD5|nr:MarR family transcriptional regulator [Acidipropionibacterium timonense]